MSRLPDALRGRVVVVDDHADTCALIRRKLAREGYTVVTAAAAEEALEGMDESRPDVVITDLRLGGMSGIELCQRIAERAPDVPVIVATGHGSLDAAVAAIRAGAYDFLTKPIDLDLLVVAVHRALERRALRREVREGVEQVRRSETSFRALIEKSPDYIVVVRDGAVTYANAAIHRGLGHREGSMLGRPLSDLLCPDDSPFVEAARDGEDGGPARKLRWLREDGRLVVSEAVAVDVTFNGALATAIIAHDLSELLSMQAKLLQADRLASLGTLAAGAAHEINNPLTYVLLNADVMQRGLGSALATLSPEHDALRPRLEAMHTSLSRVVEGTERVRDIVKSLKTFSRGEVDRMTLLDVRHVVEASIAMVMHEIRPRARLLTTLGDTSPVHANEARLGQVFVNLLINAAQAIPPGSADQHEIHVTVGTEDGGRVFVAIRDSGIGMEPPVVKNIFEPFFTTKPVGQGMGLGLSISHGIVSSLGGEIRVESVPGVGSTFRVSLPAGTAHGIEPAEPTRPLDEPAIRSRILIVDDEEDIGVALTEALEREADVTFCSNARDALELVRGGTRFDLILCDVSMPVMTGPELHHALDAVCPEQASRMIFMTGGAFTEEAHALLARASTVWIAKPPSLAVLRAELARVAQR